MISDVAAVSRAVFDGVEKALGDQELKLHYEYMPADRAKLPVMSLQTLAGDPIERCYLDGSYIGRYRFAIYLRQASDDDAGRLRAIETLESAATLIDSAKLALPKGFSFYRCTQENMPHMIASDDPYNDYQVTFAVSYGKTNRRN